jgi:hypothetical protein
MPGLCLIFSWPFGPCSCPVCTWNLLIHPQGVPKFVSISGRTSTWIIFASVPFKRN